MFFCTLVNWLFLFHNSLLPQTASQTRRTNGGAGESRGERVHSGERRLPRPKRKRRRRERGLQRGGKDHCQIAACPAQQSLNKMIKVAEIKMDLQLKLNYELKSISRGSRR